MEFALRKSTQKWFFVDFILFNQVGPEQLSFWISLKQVKEKSEAVFVDKTFANVQDDVESMSFFKYMFSYVCFYHNKYVCLHACVHNCTFYVWTNNWKKGKNENFMYKFMRIHVYNNKSVYENVYLFISIHNCA